MRRNRGSSIPGEPQIVCDWLRVTDRYCVLDWYAGSAETRLGFQCAVRARRLGAVFQLVLNNSYRINESVRDSTNLLPVAVDSLQKCDNYVLGTSRVAAQETATAGQNRLI